MVINVSSSLGVQLHVFWLGIPLESTAIQFSFFFLSLRSSFCSSFEDCDFTSANIENLKEKEQDKGSGWMSANDITLFYRQLEFLQRNQKPILLLIS